MPEVKNVGLYYW